MSRIPELLPAGMTDAQRAVFDKITSGPRGSVRGPFLPLMHCPGAADPIQELGAYYRFNGILPGRLRELSILVTARFWGAQFEWAAHSVIAEKEGVDPAVIEAISKNEIPTFTSGDDQVVYSFCKENHETHRVSDKTYQQATEILGHAGVVELVSLCGYYTLISMVLNTFDVPSPDPDNPPLEV